jgi:regulator of replication initiation timing
MANEQILISGIEYKVRKLIEDNSRLKSENGSLQDKLELITEKVNNLTKELETNKNELFKYTLANTLEIEYGVEEGKKKIDNLIKEIDMCIEVLSH